MTVSSDGQLCFGIAFDEDVEFPWDGDEFEGDEEAWWYDGILCYKPPFEIYDSDGEYIDGVRPSEERIREYYDARSAFKKSRPPLPVVVVKHCSYSYPKYIIAVRDTVASASRGYPEELNLTYLAQVAEDGAGSVIEFCDTYGIELPDAPNNVCKWWLSSLYG